jgi:outer membrane receptor protein involved in Fe transport
LDQASEEAPWFRDAGRISGVVRDASGAALPGVTITVTNEFTRAAQTATSGVDGSYSVTLAPGTYSASATLKGFARQTRRGVALAAGATANADFVLEARLEEEGQGGQLKLGFNAPLGDKAAVRAAGYYNRLAGYMDTPGITRTSNGSIRPDPGSTVEDVNSGDRFGVRAAIRFEPNERLDVTPRVVYQKVQMDGWNRIDDFNILANPFTSSRPAVTLGDRRLFVQIDEPFTDEFTLADLTIGLDLGGGTSLASITSYTKRDVLVVRDAGALTSSITGGSIGLPERAYSLDAPLDDATEAEVLTQELRLSGSRDRLKWLVGAFYADTTRDYGQSLLVSGFESLTGIPTAGRFGAGRDVLYYSDLHYELTQMAAFGEATYTVSDRVDLTLGLRYYDFEEERTQVFDGIFADPASKPGTADASGVAPRFIVTYKASPNTNVNVQVAKGFRLGGINDQLNVPLCTPADLAAYSGFDAWEDEKTWNYEIGSKSQVLGGRGSFNASLFYVDIRDLQATVTAGSCSSRLILNVPKARSAGAEFEFAAAPSENVDFLGGGRLQRLATAFDDRRHRRRRPGRDPRGQPAAQRAAVPDVGDGDLPAAAERRPPGLRDGHLPARRLALHADRRRGGGPGHAQRPLVRSQHDRRPADPGHLHLRPVAARVPDRQRAGRRAVRQVRRGALREQPDRRAGAPGARPRARPACARRLPDEPAAHVRPDRPRRLLTSSSGPPP